MFGILLAALAGVLFSIGDAGKKALSSTFHPEAIILFMSSFGLVVTLGCLAVSGFPSVYWQGVWLPLIICAGLAVAGELAFVYGLRGTDLSLAKPLGAVFPLFSAMLGFFLFGEVPRLIGALGVGVIVLGAYLLGISFPVGKNVFAPLKRLTSDKGCQLILLSAFIGAVIMVTQRFGAQHSSPLAFFALLLVLVCFVFLVLVWRGGAVVADARPSRKAMAVLVVSGLSWAGGAAMVYVSFNNALAAYAAAASQTQVLLSIVIGAVVFKEGAYTQRMLAGLVMVVGVVLVSLGAS